MSFNDDTTNNSDAHAALTITTTEVAALYEAIATNHSTGLDESVVEIAVIAASCALKRWIDHRFSATFAGRSIHAMWVPRKFSVTDDMHATWNGPNRFAITANAMNAHLLTKSFMYFVVSEFAKLIEMVRKQQMVANDCPGLPDRADVMARLGVFEPFVNWERPELPHQELFRNLADLRMDILELMEEPDMPEYQELWNLWWSVLDHGGECFKLYAAAH